MASRSASSQRRATDHSGCSAGGWTARLGELGVRERAHAGDRDDRDQRHDEPGPASRKCHGADPPGAVSMPSMMPLPDDCQDADDRPRHATPWCCRASGTRACTSPPWSSPCTRSGQVGLHFWVSVPQIVAAIGTCFAARGRDHVLADAVVRLARERDAHRQRGRPDHAGGRHRARRPLDDLRVVRVRRGRRACRSCPSTSSAIAARTSSTRRTSGWSSAFVVLGSTRVEPLDFWWAPLNLADDRGLRGDHRRRPADHAAPAPAAARRRRSGSRCSIGVGTLAASLALHGHALVVRARLRLRLLARDRRPRPRS